MPVYKKVNKDFFKKWNAEMAYVLGFFAADGYITINKRGGQFWSIQVTDKKLIGEIRNVVESEHKISVRQKREIHHKLLYRLQIGSIEMCEDLRGLGFGQRKTKSLAVPSVPQKYFGNFTRGYFDGDGNTWVGKIHKDRKKHLVVIRSAFTSCSEEFLRVFQERLEDEAKLKGVLSNGKGDFHRLTYSVHDSLKLYDFMYNQCVQTKTGLFLKRKKDVFERYIEMQS